MDSNDKDKILIIDDTKLDRVIIKECLTAQGFDNLSFAKNAEKGLELIKEINPKVVIVDTNMPVMDGFQVTRKIKEQHENIKIILFTGQARSVDFPKAKEIGVDEYTIKTPNCDELVAAIRRCLNHSPS